MSAIASILLAAPDRMARGADWGEAMNPPRAYGTEAGFRHAIVALARLRNVAPDRGAPSDRFTRWAHTAWDRQDYEDAAQVEVLVSGACQ